MNEYLRTMYWSGLKLVLVSQIYFAMGMNSQDLWDRGHNLASYVVPTILSMIFTGLAPFFVKWIAAKGRVNKTDVERPRANVEIARLQLPAQTQLSPWRRMKLR